MYNSTVPGNNNSRITIVPGNKKMQKKIKNDVQITPAGPTRHNRVYSLELAIRKKKNIIQNLIGI